MSYVMSFPCFVIATILSFLNLTLTFCNNIFLSIGRNLHYIGNVCNNVSRTDSVCTSQRYVYYRKSYDLYTEFSCVLTSTTQYHGRSTFWCVDSGSSVHICCNADMFTSIDYNAESISISGVSYNPVNTEGLGSCRIPVKDLSDHTIRYLELDDVYLISNQPHNLISVKKLIDRYSSAHSPDFKNLVWHFGKPITRSIKLEWRSNMYRLKPVTKSEFDDLSTDDSSVVLPAQLNKYVCKTLTLSDALYNELTMLYSKGTPVVNLFANSMTDAERFSLTWKGKSFYGILSPNLPYIQRCLSKAHADFDSDSTHLWVLPYLPKASYWFYAKYYETAHIFPCDTSDVFSVHKNDWHLFAHLMPDDFDPVESSPDYVYLPKLPFPMAVLYRDSYTPMQTDDYVKCHLRFGHRSAKYIQALIESGVNLGSDIHVSSDALKNVSHLCHCESCILTRMQRPHHKPLDSKRYSHLGYFESIVSDITGPISPMSHDGDMYVIHFTCVKSRYTWGACMRSRNEAMFYFAQFLEFVTESGYSTKAVRFLKTDKGGEYTSHEFMEFCRSKGIKKIFSTPYAHEENGMAEVIWRDIAAVARAMILTAQLPSDLWHLAYNHSFWLRCRMPHIENDMQIPFNLIFPDAKLDLSNVRVFGCQAYQWLDPDQRYI